MCNPAAMAMASGGQAIVGEVMANDERRKSNKIKEEAAALHRENFQNQVSAIASNTISQQFATFEAKHQRYLEGLKNRAFSQTAASATGSEGLSVDAVLADFNTQIGAGNSSIDQQLEIAKSNTGLQLEGLQLSTKGQLFNLRKEAFNPMAAALRIGSSAFQGYTTGKSIYGNRAPKPSASNPAATNTGKTHGPTRSDYIPSKPTGPRQGFAWSASNPTGL